MNERWEYELHPDLYPAKPSHQPGTSPERPSESYLWTWTISSRWFACALAKSRSSESVERENLCDIWRLVMFGKCWCSSSYKRVYIAVAGWWFQSFFIVHFILYGMSSFPLTFLFFKMVKTTNQIIIPLFTTIKPLLTIVTMWGPQDS